MRIMLFQELSSFLTIEDNYQFFKTLYDGSGFNTTRILTFLLELVHPCLCSREHTVKRNKSETDLFLLDLFMQPAGASFLVLRLAFAALLLMASRSDVHAAT